MFWLIANPEVMRTIFSKVSAPNDYKIVIITETFQIVISY